MLVPLPCYQDYEQVIPEYFFRVMTIIDRLM